MANDFWSIVVLVGLTGWISAALALIFTAFPKRDSFNAGCAWKWGLALVCSYGIWIAGILNA